MSDLGSARVADYVLGLMDLGEAERFEREMARDPALAAEVRDGHERLHELDETATPRPVDAALWARIEAGLDAIGSAREQATEGLAAPATRRPRRFGWGSFWNSLGFWRPVGLAGMASSAALAAGFALVLSVSPPAPQFVAILVPEDGSAAGAIVEVDTTGEARLIPLRDIPVPEGYALEVWTLPDPEGGPVSIGLLERARSLELALEGLPPTHGEQLFEITLETDTGSPIGRPTGPVLFKGLTARTL